MGGSISKEVKLAKRLKELCDDNGKETNPQESATVLHKFGLLYKNKSPDKISLIQSAAFLNAAIVRQQKNNQFKNDLKSLCSHVLEVAKAKKLGADLCSISEDVLEKIRKMRDCTNESVNKIDVIPVGLPDTELRLLEEKHISATRKLQIEVSENYAEIMAYIGNKSIDIMGNPQCRYSIIGMGSLARNEITPYSDFEHVILLEEGVQYKANYEDILEYFRWVSVIFYVIVINLKETILKSVVVQWLNDDSIVGGNWFFDDHTTCGIKFDGMQVHACKIPLGRTQKTANKPFTMELIKPVSEMAKCLEVVENIKNGYHLADVLTKTCFVSGYRNVHDQFQELVKKTLISEEAINKQLIAEDIKEYFKGFDAFKQAQDILYSYTCNIKPVLYRTSTLFISALGRLLSVDKNSCFDIVDELYERGWINKCARHKLLYIISISCLARLKIYMMKNGQDDYFDNIASDFELYDSFSRLPDILGEQSYGDYFMITSKLQHLMKTSITVPLNWGDIDAAVGDKFFLLLALHLHNRILIEWKSYLLSDISEKPELDIATIVGYAYFVKDNFSQALQVFRYVDEETQDNLTDKLRVMGNVARCLYHLEKYPEALNCIKETKKLIESCQSLDDNLRCTKANLFQYEGRCKEEMGVPNKAIEAHQEALDIYNQTDSFFHKEDAIAKCHLNIAMCNHQLDKISEAMDHLNIAISMYCSLRLQSEDTCCCYALLGNCYCKLLEYPRALTCYKEAVRVRKAHVTTDKYGSDFYLNPWIEIVNDLTILIADGSGRI